MNKFYMHTVSGEVQSEQEWREDYESMEIERWFGKPREDITASDRENWLESGALIEVVKTDDGDWVEA